MNQSASQSIKVERSRFRRSSIFLNIYVGRPKKNHPHIIAVHYLWHMTCLWYKLKKSSGPKIEPCSTPNVIDASSEYALSILTIKFLFGKYDIPFDCLISTLMINSPIIWMISLKQLWKIIFNLEEISGSSNVLSTKVGQVKWHCQGSNYCVAFCKLRSELQL